MNSNILRVIRKKRRLWKVYKASKDYSEYLAYKKVENEVKSIVRNAKRNFEKKLAKNVKKNSKSFYSYLKSKTSNRSSVGPLNEGNELISDDEKMSEVLNKFFSSVFTKEDLNNLPQPRQVYIGSSPLTSAPFQKSW